MQKSWLKKWQEAGVFPYLILFVVLVIIHCFVDINHKDDAVYAKVLLDGTTIFEYLSYRYLNWSSRVPVEFALVYVAQSGLAFKIVNILAYLLMAYSFSQLLPTKEKSYKNYMVILMLLLFPMGEMDSAGWCATATGYWWTIAAGSYGMIAIKKVWNQIPIKRYEYVLYSLALIYGAGHEQMACCLIGIYTCVVIYMLFLKKKIGFLWVQFGIVVAMFTFIIIAPGNTVRTNVTVNLVRPDYYTVPFVNLLFESYADAMNYFVFYGNILFYLLVIVIFASVCIKYKEWYIRAMSAFPFLYLLIAKISDLQILPYEIRRFVLFDIYNATSRRWYLPVILSMTMLGCMVAGLFLIYENSIHFWGSTILLGIGLGSRLAAGTSGGVWGTAYRTLSFFEMIICFVCIYLLLYQEKYFRKKWIYVVLSVLALINVACLINNLIIYEGAIPMYL